MVLITICSMFLNYYMFYVSVFLSILISRVSYYSVVLIDQCDSIIIDMVFIRLRIIKTFINESAY